MTQANLARRLDVPYQRVNQIVNRRRAVTPDTALRLARVFDTTAEYWLELQLRWELSQATAPSKARTSAPPLPSAEAPRPPMIVRETGVGLGSQAVLDEIVERVVEAVDPERIVLFGSSATAEAGPGSDVDLLVVDREPFGRQRSRRRQLRRIHEALAGMGIAKDILLFSVDEVERWRSSPNHIVARALRQGRILYARP
ncbi:hypothetical protein BH20GEM1_BH20GEM1_00830 [soil metagenome]